MWKGRSQIVLVVIVVLVVLLVGLGLLGTVLVSSRVADKGKTLGRADAFETQKRQGHFTEDTEGVWESGE